MRRRAPEVQSDPLPARLRRFVPAEWLHEVQGEPPPGWREGQEAWRVLQAEKEWSRARGQWVAEHGYPGDPIDWLREQVRVRRSLLARWRDGSATTSPGEPL